MEVQLLLNSLQSSQFKQSLAHLTPYLILIVNYLLFQLARSLINQLVARAESSQQTAGQDFRRHLLRLFLHELVSTCELCADCAELNVVYEKHGAYAYGASLFLLTYLWIDAFGDAHASPGYLAEDYFLGRGNELLKTGDTYARFIGQSAAMPLAWRLATHYWNYELIHEHSVLSKAGHECKSSLATSTLNGFLIELVCCLLCRLAELAGHKLLADGLIGQRVLSGACSLVCSLLVVLALELSGGYFNPILAVALEYGCQGVELHQHAIVFWLGPLTGHVLARLIFRRYEGERKGGPPGCGSSAAVETRPRKKIRPPPAGATGAAKVTVKEAAEVGGASTKRRTRSSANQKRRDS